MAPESPRYIDVDRLLSETTLGQAAAAYGHAVEHPPSGEARIACPFECDGAAGRPISVNLDRPHKPFCCHAYRCQVRGNLLMLMYGFKHGQLPPGGQLKGADFKQIAQDLQAIAEGHAVAADGAPGETPDESSSEPAADGATPASSAAPAEAGAKSAATETSTPPVNVPLRDSPNERARALVDLDRHFVTDIENVSPAAGQYLRRRPFLTPEVMRRWRTGYLPQDASGLLRGRIVYPVLSESGEVLTWFGRDPDFEQKHRQWAAAAKPSQAEPVKTKFVKGFHRGLELFGQQAERLKGPGVRKAIAEHGIVVVEGPNDVIALDGLGVPAVGICGTVITEAQAQKVARWALSLSDGRVTLLLDCDEAGEAGAKESLWVLAETGCRVQLGWSRTMHGGRFHGHQPESLSAAEWTAIAANLRRRFVGVF